MADLSDIFESEELNEAVKAVEALLARRQPPRRMPGDRTFRELTLGKTFHAREAIAIISSSEPAYPGLKAVLSSGLVGWALFPKDREMRVVLMTQAVLQHMDDAERSVGLVDQPITVARDIVARYVLTGIEFLTEIYDQLGGYEAFSRIASLDIMADLFEPYSKTIKTTNRALAYLHHGADRFRDPEYDFAPSLNRAVTIFNELKSARGAEAYGADYVSRSLLHRRWSQTKPSLALIYSASTIKVRRKPLLEVMLQGEYHYSSHVEYLDEWLGRARYVSDHVFAKMDPPDLQNITSKLLANVEPRRFAAPRLTVEEDKILNAQFRKKFRANSA
ncbi:hypothetical protein [Rhizobium hidalgonense]|uniref:Uncharacterized protein n=1 Tax=Rhizobium hidalgonense TaxID=1538159 RepID=A0ABX4JKA4_9HYPH|nr:hypothetical protein [Rhizobium hidalgonense]PDT20041.1 hypothetical protein CO674_29780 [Rhizobium hidalgonense]PON05918.1 hypothetical protein ATY29_19205 [Rhizobium hidalgonense]